MPKPTHLPPSEEYDFGQICRTDRGHPARYIGNGLAAFVHRGELSYGPAAPATGGEEKQPLPFDGQLAAVKCWITGELTVVNVEDIADSDGIGCEEQPKGKVAFIPHRRRSTYRPDHDRPTVIPHWELREKRRTPLLTHPTVLYIVWAFVFAGGSFFLFHLARFAWEFLGGGR